MGIVTCLVQEVSSVLRAALKRVEQAGSTAELKEIQQEFLGKSGKLTGLMATIGKLPAEERPEFGATVNSAKAEVEDAISGKESQLASAELEARFEQEAIDLTLPGWRRETGTVHSLQQAMDRTIEVFSSLGFRYIETPEVEHKKYNFDVLNYPDDHPAKDDQDTFYITDDYLLRTQTTSFQGHVLEQVKPPLRYFTIGRCFRNEKVDRTHSHTFHQVDAFMIDRGVSMADLKGTLGFFAREMFGSDVRVRFRPDFFPFVEPGVDYAISCPFCGGAGCPVCKHSGWIELGGAGLVHPNILRNYGIDPEEFSGFAFGLGIERMPMMRYGIDNLKHFLDNDLRFARQFPR